MKVFADYKHDELNPISRIFATAWGLARAGFLNWHGISLLESNKVDETIIVSFHPCWKWVTLLLLFMAFFMAMFRLLGRWRRITLFTMCKRLTDFRAPRTITTQMTFLLWPLPKQSKARQRQAREKISKTTILPLYLCKNEKNQAPPPTMSLNSKENELWADFFEFSCSHLFTWDSCAFWSKLN